MSMPLRFSDLTKHLKDNTVPERSNNVLKIIEFIVVEALYIAIAILIPSKIISYDMIAIVGQIQAFIALYIVFRFRYFGLIVILSLNLIEGSFIFSKCMVSPDLSLFAGLTSKIITIISSTIVAVLSESQEKKKRKLRMQKTMLEQIAVTDGLTDVYNQRFFNIALESKIWETEKKQGSLGLILIDVDDFKMCNDLYGHDFGDNVLKITASAVKTASGKDNIVCRYGGDEFAVILPDCDLQTAKEVAQNIRAHFEEVRFGNQENNLLNKVTLSMGLSVYPGMAGNKDELISQADMALYHSKNLGKNNIQFYQNIIQQLRKSITSDHQQLIGVFKTLLSTISIKDKYTLGHCERVSSYAVKIGKELNLGIKDIMSLQYAGLLHDIGKVEIPKSILNKNSPLTADECEIIKKHPVYSANILEPLDGMDQLIDFVIHHHERYDGKGYPHGLSGEEISLGARILCVADSFDAMLSERPYSKASMMNEAFVELEQCAGTQFDPIVVRAFISSMKKISKSDALILN